MILHVCKLPVHSSKFNFCPVFSQGEFQLEHSNQQEIFRCMSSKMKNMRQLLPALGSTNSEFEVSLLQHSIP